MDNIDEWVMLKKLTEVVELFWVKTHCGIKANEIVDKIAKSAVNIVIKNTIPPQDPIYFLQSKQIYCERSGNSIDNIIYPN